MQALSDDGAARENRRVPGPHRQGPRGRPRGRPQGGSGGGHRRDPRGSLRRRPRGLGSGARNAALRRPADRRHGPARRQDRRDEDGRGQDPGRDDARLPERPDRPRRARRHGQRLPGPTRRRVDGQDLHVPGPDRRLHPEPPARRRAQGRVRLRRDLRHEQRVRVRLPARQHEVRAREHGPARARLRDRGRGRLDPDRRGPHAADHLRTQRGKHRRLLQVQPGHPPPGQGQGREGQARQQDHHRRLPDRREVPDGRADRGRRREGREVPGHRQHVRAHQHRPAPRRRAGPPRPHPVQARRRLHDPGRPGPDRRRIHRTRPARPPLVGRAPPGRRGQGERQDRAGEPDPGDHHPAELFSSVREAGRHDRHGGHRGVRVSPDLQARRGGHPDQHAHDPRRQPGRRLRLGAREVRRPGRRDRPAAGEGSAGPGRHRVDREVRTALRAPEETQGAPRRPERQVPREGGRDRGPGRPVGRRHDRDQHGGPRHRHRARRQSRRGGHARAQGHPGPGRVRQPSGDAARDLRGGQAEGPGGGRAAHHRHRAARVPARGQPAPRPQRTPGRPRLVALLPLAGRRPDAHLRLGSSPEHHAQARHGGRRPDRARHGLALHRARAEAGRGTQLRDPQAPAGVRRRHEPPARGDLRHAPGDPARRAGPGPHPRAGRDDRGLHPGTAFLGGQESRGVGPGGRRRRPGRSTSA